MKLLRQLGTMGGARAIEAIVQALLLILVAREVGPTLFGLIAVYHAAHSVIFVITGMNTATFVVREEALGRRDLAYGALRANALLVTCSLGLMIAASLLVVQHPFVAIAVGANAIGAWSQQLSDNRLSLSLAHQVVRPAFVTITTRSASSFVVFVALLTIGADATIAFAAARLAASMLSLMLAVRLVRLDRKILPAPIRTVFKVQFPLAVAPAASSLRNLDAMIVASVAGLAASGMYSAATRIVTPIGLIAPALTPVLIPRLAIASARRAVRALDILLYTMLVATILPVVIWPKADEIIVFVFGEDYSGGGDVLVWVLFRVGPLLVGGLIAGVLQSQRLDGRVAVNSIGVAVCVLLGAFLGALVAGAGGAALGIAIVSIAGSVRLWFVGRKALKDK